MVRSMKKLVVFVCLIVFAGTGFAINDEERARMKSAAPEKASVAPKQARRVLIFNLCQGFRHSAIPYGNKAIRVIGKKTGAFESDSSEDKAVFTAENLKKYDAIIFNNTTGLTFNQSQRKAIMDFIEKGKGIVGIVGQYRDCRGDPGIADPERKPSVVRQVLGRNRI